MSPSPRHRQRTEFMRPQEERLNRLRNTSFAACTLATTQIGPEGIRTCPLPTRTASRCTTRHRARGAPRADSVRRPRSGVLCLPGRRVRQALYLHHGGLAGSRPDKSQGVPTSRSSSPMMWRQSRFRYHWWARRQFLRKRSMRRLAPLPTHGPGPIQHHQTHESRLPKHCSRRRCTTPGELQSANLAQVVRPGRRERTWRSYAWRRFSSGETAPVRGSQVRTKPL